VGLRPRALAKCAPVPDQILKRELILNSRNHGHSAHESVLIDEISFTQYGFVPIDDTKIERALESWSSKIMAIHGIETTYTRLA